MLEQLNSCHKLKFENLSKSANMCFEKICENVMEAKSDEKNENDQRLFFFKSEFFSKSPTELLLLLNALSLPFFY
jgi:hypothetical protein